MIEKYSSLILFSVKENVKKEETRTKPRLNMISTIKQVGDWKEKIRKTHMDIKHNFDVNKGVRSMQSGGAALGNEVRTPNPNKNLSLLPLSALIVLCLTSV